MVRVGSLDHKATVCELVHLLVDSAELEGDIDQGSEHSQQDQHRGQHEDI
jgi:hypothetical protein